MANSVNLFDLSENEGVGEYFDIDDMTGADSEGNLTWYGAYRIQPEALANFGDPEELGSDYNICLAELRETINGRFILRVTTEPVSQFFPHNPNEESWEEYVGELNLVQWPTLYSDEADADAALMKHCGITDKHLEGLSQGDIMANTMFDAFIKLEKGLPLVNVYPY